MSIYNTDNNSPKFIKENIIQKYKIKSFYLAKCAHELKNILISIISFIENCNITLNENGTFINEFEKEKNMLTPEKCKNFLKSLCDLGMNLIFDINRLSKEENKPTFSKEKKKEFNLIEALNFCLQIFESRCLFDKKDIKIEKSFNLPYNKKIHSINEIKFKQVIINLLSNSYKFTIKGFIKLTAETLNNKIKITISDSGVGFSNKEMNELNKPFLKIENNEYLNENGSGLGLYIIKEILEFSGSELKFESKKGFGSKFWFELDDNNIIDPTIIINENFKKLISEINLGYKDKNQILSENNTTQVDSINETSSIKISRTFSKFQKKNNIKNNTFFQNKNIINKKTKKKNSTSLFRHKLSLNNNVINFNFTNNIRAFTISHDFKTNDEGIFNQKSLKILICDDDRYTALSTRNSIMKFFKKRIFNSININSSIQLPEIIISQNGIECLYFIYNNFLKDNLINILFIDINMPFIDGITTCSIIKNCIEFSDIKIYMLSSEIINDFECKADGFYQKPLTFNLMENIFPEQNEDHSFY